MSLDKLVDGHNKYETIPERVAKAEQNIQQNTHKIVLTEAEIRVLHHFTEILGNNDIDIGGVLKDLSVRINDHVQESAATLKLMGENLDNTHASSHEL